MRLFYITGIAALLFSAAVNGQQTYRTEASGNIVKTLQVRVSGDVFSDPIIPLNGEEQVEISFDVLNQGYQYYSYSIIHCDANWQQSSLSPVEYMNGFSGLPVEDYTSSMATTTHYTNYRLLLPNNEVQLKLSGNYAVVIRSDDDPGRVLATACFSVAEPLANISATITGNTDLDTNHSHQQIGFSIHHPQLHIAYPQNDLKVKVYQNNREDNMVTNLSPVSISGNQIVYDHIRELIFEAGNEYRRFEFLSHAYNGIRVEDISFFNPYYHVTLFADQSRAGLSYLYDQDQNGRTYINCSRCNDPASEADYYMVHFAYPSQPIPGGNLYLLSDIYNNVLDEKSLMKYNQDTRQYEKPELLKQGHYNYMYVFVPDKQQRGATSLTEGDYYQSENEYRIMVYYRPMGERYDRLIGVQWISNANN